jgi:RNA ligase
MTGARHPARVMDFDTLTEGLERARVAGHVYARHDRDSGRTLYCYTTKCVYEQAWTEFTILARGLILDLAAKRIVATPFPKFFNLGEGGRPVPDLPFEVFDKLDGSLIILHHHGGRWRTATKGSFDSDQALWARAWLDAHDLTPLVEGVTYLGEAISPANRIVIRYETETLALLAAYAADGLEITYDDVAATAARLGWPVPERRTYPSLAALIAETNLLPKTVEGFVLRFSDGTRFKAKGAEYRRIHALISRCTPLAMWEAMAAGDDMEAIRRDLPEELWEDFDAITRLLQSAYDDLVARIAETSASVAHLSEKELGLALNTLPAETRGYVFGFRKSGGAIDVRARQALFRQIRPVGNDLPGYVPSFAMNRVREEAG